MRKPSFAGGPLLLGTLAVSCVGIAGSAEDGVGGGADGPGIVVPSKPAAAAILSSPVLRRLTVDQYIRSVSDLLGLGVAETAIEPDLVGGGRIGFGSVGAGHVTTSPHGVELYDASARRLARLTFANTTRRRELVDCEPGAMPATDACVKRFLTVFGRRVWRRPLTDDEIGRYQAAVARSASEVGGTIWGALELVTAAMLESPNFLYRAELGEAVANDPKRRRLTDFEIAGRLSFLVLDTTPDDALLDAAARGELNTAKGLKAQADRLLASPQARRTIASFFTEWLGVERLDGLTKDKMVYPTFSPSLGAAMQEEIAQLVMDLAFDRDADFLQALFEGRDTFVNGQLAAFYGLPTPMNPGAFSPATLPADGPRAGFLTSGAFLSANARVTMTSPTLRGLFIRNRLMCQTIPPPPPNVKSNLPPPEPGKPETTRQRLERHRTDPTCAGCHGQMDPLGLALEQFDGIGAFRTGEAGMTIDVTGEIDGATFDGARQLGAALRASERTGPCVARQLYRYAVGRVEEDDGEGGVDAITQQWRSGGLRWKNLFGSLILSDGFHYVKEVR